MSSSTILLTKIYPNSIRGGIVTTTTTRTVTKNTTKMMMFSTKQTSTLVRRKALSTSSFRHYHQQRQENSNAILQLRNNNKGTSKRYKSSSDKSTSSSTAESASTAATKTTTTEAASTTTNTTNNVPIGMSLFAAFLGVTTVAGVAAGIESYTSKDLPPFSLTKDRFDQTNFSGRFCRMILACDPTLLIYTESQVREKQQLLENYNNTTQSTTTISDHELWEARRIKESALHPDTGDWIPRPFRMSGYVPFNGPICVAMVSSTSTLPLLFWSWINQSQNALVNYYNRNASSEMTNETLMKSYVAAVGSALTVAFGLSTFIQKRYSPDKAKQLLRWVAFPSSVAASSLNCYIVRSPEIDTGIPLLDSDGNNVLDGETSIEAAKLGVYLTTASRALLQAPVFFLPPLLLSIGPLKSLVTNKPQLLVPVSTYCLLVSFGIGLPGTVAVFPQISSIDANKVEEKFHHLRDKSTNEQYKKFYYNKGL